LRKRTAGTKPGMKKKCNFVKLQKHPQLKRVFLFYENLFYQTHGRFNHFFSNIGF
jgi:hypothetical protein